MTKEKVIELLKEIGAIETKEIERGYIKYIWGNVNLWLGNAYIEDERQNLAFPYKEERIKMSDLINFLNKRYKFD